MDHEGDKLVFHPPLMVAVADGGVRLLFCGVVMSQTGLDCIDNRRLFSGRRYRGRRKLIAAMLELWRLEVGGAEFRSCHSKAPVAVADAPVVWRKGGDLIREVPRYLSNLGLPHTATRAIR